MSVSAVVGTAALLGILGLFALVGVVLAVVEKHLAPTREH